MKKHIDAYSVSCNSPYMEKLQAYINKRHPNITDFADKAGVAASTLYRAFNGTSDLDRETCRKIEVATRGKIRAIHLITEQLRKSV